MRRSRERALHRLLLAALVSLGVHLLVVIPFGRWIAEVPEPGPAAPSPAAPAHIETTMLTEEEVAQLLAQAQRAPEETLIPPPPDPPEPPRPQEVRPDGQVVEIPPPVREERPDDARFLAEYDSKVEKEQAKRTNEPPSPRMMKGPEPIISPGDDPEGTRDPVEAARRPQPDQPRAQQDAPGRATRPSDKVGDPRPPQPEPPTVSQAPPAKSELPEGVDGQRPTSDPQGAIRRRPSGGDGQVGGAQAPSDYRALLPTMGPEEMARNEGTFDRLEDVDEGDRTQLNAKEYKYASFFNRVKRSVQERWRAVDAHRRHDPYGRIYGVRDRVTIVEVTLNADGALEDIFVKKDSGVAFLDEAAVRAFREAQPFPHPPVGLQDPDGRIRFRFGFYLEIDGGGFRMFRSQ